MHVTNLLADTTTTHCHGLHVAPMNDGSPQNPLMASDTWTPSFTVMDNAATYWYHPHLHAKTMDQVLKGAAGRIIVRATLLRALLRCHALMQ
jgi:blue copper oxidase